MEREILARAYVSYNLIPIPILNKGKRSSKSRRCMWNRLPGWPRAHAPEITMLPLFGKVLWSFSKICVLLPHRNGSKTDAASVP